MIHLFHTLRRPRDEPRKISLKNISRSLRRFKSKPYPKVPKTRLQLQKSLNSSSVIRDFGFNLDETARLYFDTVLAKDYLFTVFASNDIINIVKQNIEPGKRKYLLDGTFKVVPKQFYQLLIIAIEFKNDVSHEYD